ncbi:MAG: polyprenyl synthetase family protein, partial [Bryobacteraceae bacterium]|nr:polyprenyl synthetase family protein [Bryobacteraceae bacterium]
MARRPLVFWAAAVWLWERLGRIGAAGAVACEEVGAMVWTSQTGRQTAARLANGRPRPAATVRVIVWCAAIGLKTSLLAAGAMAGGATEPEQAMLSEFGWNLGMAFQIVDDILDFTARESVLGKPVGNDLREGKVTLPLCYAMESAAAEERALVERVLAERAYESVSFEQIRSLLVRHGGIERA